MGYTTIQRRAKCVEIARDVLLQLRLGRIVPGGGYTDPTRFQDGYSGSLNEGVSGNAQTAFSDYFAPSEEPVKPCNVCALGSMLVSHIFVNNEVTTENYVKDSTDARKIAVKTLGKYFYAKDLDLIESTFEREPFGKISDEDLVRACIYASRYLMYSYEDQEFDIYEEWDRTELLRVLMLNIIRNGGRFKFPLWVERSFNSLNRKYKESSKNDSLGFPITLGEFVNNEIGVE